MLSLAVFDITQLFVGDPRVFIWRVINPGTGDGERHADPTGNHKRHFSTDAAISKGQHRPDHQQRRRRANPVPILNSPRNAVSLRREPFGAGFNPGRNR